MRACVFGVRRGGRAAVWSIYVSLDTDTSTDMPVKRDDGMYVSACRSSRYAVDCSHYAFLHLRYALRPAG